MINAALEWLTEVYSWLPGGYILPMIGATIGFSYAMYRYIRSFKYLYYYYIETGEVLWWMDCDKHKEMIEMNKQHRLKLDDRFKNFGYVGGMFSLVPFTVLGIGLGSIWPVVVVVGILTIPNLLLRHIAREKRTKAIFQQTLKGDKA